MLACYSNFVLWIPASESKHIGQNTTSKFLDFVGSLMVVAARDSISFFKVPRPKIIFNRDGALMQLSDSLNGLFEEFGFYDKVRHAVWSSFDLFGTPKVTPSGLRAAVLGNERPVWGLGLSYWAGIRSLWPACARIKTGFQRSPRKSRASGGGCRCQAHAGNMKFKTWWGQGVDSSCVQCDNGAHCRLTWTRQLISTSLEMIEMMTRTTLIGTLRRPTNWWMSWLARNSKFRFVASHSEVVE